MEDGEFDDEDNKRTAGGGASSSTGININSLDDLVLEPATCDAAIKGWNAFLASSESKEAAGEAIYSALFEGAPSLQPLFTTPRAVQAMRFMNSLQSFISEIKNPQQLKTLVETLGFQHLHLDVTVPRVVIFRDSIIDLFLAELGEEFSTIAMEGWRRLLNYMGGALIFVKSNYAERVRIIIETWQKANDKQANDAQMLGEDSSSGDEHDEKKKEKKLMLDAGQSAEKEKKTVRSRLQNAFKREAKTDVSVSGEHQESAAESKKQKTMGQTVPTVYPEMFHFNAAVMGFGASMHWMDQILEQFGNIVLNISNASRVQEECDVLAVRISKVVQGSINLYEYKACMLASLRSLLPKDWSPAHEVAWTWLWDNVQSLILKSLSNPPVYSKAITRFLENIDEEVKFELRRQIFNTFFVAAPAGQEFFKQSNTRLHYIADQVLNMTRDIFVDPVKMVDDISGVGLRHVGYGIPVELFGPYVTSFIEILATNSTDEKVIEAFRWSFGLISKMLVRTIAEGSTIVMKAINNNSAKMLRKAIAAAPRGERADWMLVVQVGSQSISPLEWALESGSLDAAREILLDLLSFKADRQNYYYGADKLFSRHNDIIKMLCNEAPTLLPVLLDGLIWRSRDTTNGVRRVNYYVKNLVVTKSGGVAKALHWFAKLQDCKVISHPVNVLVSDTMWKGIVRRHFLAKKIGFLISLFVFLGSQSILPKLASNDSGMLYLRIIILSGRVITYLFSMTRQIFFHGKKIFESYRMKDLYWFLRMIPLPKYLKDPQDFGTFVLVMLLIAMLTQEPMILCHADDNWPTDDCDAHTKFDSQWWYAVFSMVAMMLHWLLIVDLSVFSTKLSAFVLVCRQVLGEVSRFLVALSFLLFTFGTAIACLRRDHLAFKDVTSTIVSLFAITCLMMPRDYRELQYDPALLFAVIVFVCASAILLLNLLIAQLNCSYEHVYQDMLGYAHLNRASVIMESLQTCSETRWQRFVTSLRLDQRVEFNEGDLGLPGAIQLLEPASLNPVTVERITRYGGTCSPEMRWPEETSSSSNNMDRYERMEHLVKKTLKKFNKMKEAAKLSHGSSIDDGLIDKFSDGSKRSTSSSMSFEG